MRSPTKHPHVLLQVFHLLNALVCILRSVVFSMHNRVQHISPPILGRVLLDLPGLLFFTTYTLLVRGPVGKLFADAVLVSCCLAGIVSSRHSKSDGWTGCILHHACCYLSARCQWQGAYSSAQTVTDLSMGHACCACQSIVGGHQPATLQFKCSSLPPVAAGLLYRHVDLGHHFSLPPYTLLTCPAGALLG